MKDYTDYIVIVFFKDGTRHQHYLEAPKAKKVGLVIRGENYHLDLSKSHKIKWFPWVDFNWWNPFTMLRYISMSKQHKVGLLVFKEGDPEPIYISETIPEHHEKFGPAAVKVQVDSKNFQRYQASQKFRTGAGTPVWVWYLLIGVIILLAVLFFTGHLQ